mgnify:CR=1 FL=1
MTTQTFRVVRVRSGHSPVARIDGADEDGLEIHLEVKADAAHGASTDHVLVVNWSLHALPIAPRPAESSATSPAAVVDAEFSTRPTSRSASRSHGTVATSKENSRPRTGDADAAAVDREFMALIAGGRPSRAAPAVTSRDIDQELSTLLGAAGAKGQK